MNEKLVARDQFFVMKGYLIAAIVLLLIQTVVYTLDCFLDFLRVLLYYDIVIAVFCFIAAALGMRSLYILVTRCPLSQALVFAKAQFCFAMPIFIFIFMGHCHSLYDWMKISSGASAAADAGLTFFRITIAGTAATINLGIVEVLLAKYILSFPVTRPEALDDTDMRIL